MVTAKHFDDMLALFSLILMGCMISFVILILNIISDNLNDGCMCSYYNWIPTNNNQHLTITKEFSNIFGVYGTTTYYRGGLCQYWC